MTAERYPAEFAEVHFRIGELAQWVRDFIAQGRPIEAAFWARELCRIARQLPEYSMEAHDERR